VVGSAILLSIKRLDQRFWLGGVLRRENVVVKLDRIRGLFLLCTCLLLFPQFLNEPWQTLGVRGRKMIFPAEVQVVAEPFLMQAVQPYWN
jgi:hypothetical protein